MIAVITIPIVVVVVSVVFALIHLMRKAKQDSEITEHYDSGQRALGNHLCKCGLYYVPHAGTIRKDGTAHTVRLCFPEREEIDEKGQGKNGMS